MSCTALVILNYNNINDTINCIESVERYNTSPVKYIVIDNGSSVSGAVEKLHDYLLSSFGERYLYLDEGIDCPDVLPYVTFLVCQKNEGYARGNNKGLGLAYLDNTLDRVMILNNDILFVEDIIPELISVLNSLPDAAIVSPLLYQKNGTDLDLTCARRKSTIGEEIIYHLLHFLLPRYIDRKLEERRYMLINGVGDEMLIPIALPSGSCMLMNKLLFKSIGSFDPNTFLYWEEQILCEKIERLGKRNYLYKEVKCVHLGGASTIISVNNKFTRRCSDESMLYYWKNYSDCSKVEYAVLQLSIRFNILATSIRSFFGRCLRFISIK